MDQSHPRLPWTDTLGLKVPETLRGDSRRCLMSTHICLVMSSRRRQGVRTTPSRPRFILVGVKNS